jgi:uncharacterized protein YndB with AHSA1/START domain
MTEHRARVLRIERTFDAPVERVFEAWTSEEVLRRWLHGMRDPSDGAESGATGEYRVVDPPHRLVFTWVWDDQPDQPQLIELKFFERDGATTVLMTNSSIPTDERWESQQRGWNVCYDNLERVLAG